MLNVLPKQGTQLAANLFNLYNQSINSRTLLDSQLATSLQMCVHVYIMRCNIITDPWGLSRWTRYSKSDFNSYTRHLVFHGWAGFQSHFSWVLVHHSIHYPTLFICFTKYIPCIVILIPHHCTYCMSLSPTPSPHPMAQIIPRNLRTSAVGSLQGMENANGSSTFKLTYTLIMSYVFHSMESVAPLHE